MRGFDSLLLDRTASPSKARIVSAASSFPDELRVPVKTSLPKWSIGITSTSNSRPSAAACP